MIGRCVAITVTPSASWRKTKLRVYLLKTIGNIFSITKQLFFYCWIKKKENPLAIDVWLCLLHSVHIQPKQFASKEEEKLQNYLCKHQTYQQIWIMQKLNRIRIIKDEQNQTEHIVSRLTPVFLQGFALTDSISVDDYSLQSDWFRLMVAPVRGRCVCAFYSALFRQADACRFFSLINCVALKKSQVCILLSLRRT